VRFRTGGVSYTTEIYHEFTFEAAHRLLNLPEGHKCARLHGHTFKVLVYVRGEVDPKTGWVMDYGDIENAFKPIFDLIDHRYLNDVPGIGNPTSENISLFIFERLKLALPTLYAVTVKENCMTGSTVYANYAKG
jgi:6-pyruvoyltetrahydropterin/6-carboxytetrahydropterin synthase